MGKSIQLIVKRGDQVMNTIAVQEGSVTIGRKPDNRITLPDPGVSRQHAIISFNDDRWSLEDMDSANKTFLNGAAIRKADIKNGDIVKIAEFTIEVISGDLADKEETAAASDDTVTLESASLSTPRDEVIVRKPDAAHAPAMRLAARRLTDFAQAVEVIGAVKNLDEMMPVLLNLTLQQFTAFRVWCGIRSQKTGPATFQLGKRRDGKPLELSQIRLSPKITESLERGQSLVLPQVSAKLETSERIRSAMIASIKRTTGSYGVIYVDNAMVHEHYSLSDLDYLMVLAMHVAGVLKTFL